MGFQLSRWKIKSKSTLIKDSCGFDPHFFFNIIYQDYKFKTESSCLFYRNCYCRNLSILIVERTQEYMKR